MAPMTKSKGPKGLQLEVGPRPGGAPRLLVFQYFQTHKLCFPSWIESSYTGMLQSGRVVVKVIYLFKVSLKKSLPAFLKNCTFHYLYQYHQTEPLLSIAEPHGYSLWEIVSCINIDIKININFDINGLSLWEVFYCFNIDIKINININMTRMFSMRNCLLHQYWYQNKH